MWTQLETVGRIEDDQGFVVKPQNGSSKENLHWPRRPKAFGAVERMSHHYISPDQRSHAPKADSDSERLTGPKNRWTDPRPKHRWLKLRFLLPFSMFTVHKIPSPQMKKGAVASTKRPKQGLQQNYSRPARRYSHGPRLVGGRFKTGGSGDCTFRSLAHYICHNCKTKPWERMPLQEKHRNSGHWQSEP